MKFLGMLFLLVGTCILLIAGVAAMQAQTNVGDTVINDTAGAYPVYEQLKTTTSGSMLFVGYTPYILAIILFAVLAVMVVGTVVVISRF